MAGTGNQIQPKLRLAGAFAEQFDGGLLQTGEEIVSIRGLQDLAPRKQLIVELYRPSDGRIARFPVRCRIDTPTELEYFKNGGVLNYVLRNLARAD